MTDDELHRLLMEEKAALQRYAHIKVNFVRNPEVVESARQLLMQATAALLKYQDTRGG
jgi:hypothetical protein